MFKVLLGFLFTISFTTHFAFAEVLTTEQKLNDFDQLNYMIQSQYGPFKYKQEVVGLNLLELKQKYKTQIEKTTTNAEYYYLLVQYVAEFRDGHFGIYVPSTSRRSVPVMTDLVEGKVLIDSVDRSELSQAEFPYERGDEILSVNGQPVQEVIAQLRRFVSYGNELGRHRIAAQLIFNRSGALLPAPTNEVLTVQVRRGTSTIVETVTLHWKTEGTAFDEIRPTQLMKNRGFSLADQTQAPMATKYDQLSNRAVKERYLSPKRMERTYQCSGGTRVHIPKDAVMVVTEPFVAYYHPTAKGYVGYLRVPHYSWGRDQEAVYQKYVYAIQTFEKNTVGLIIDQDHNCGGSVQLVEDMVSLFLNEPADPLVFELRASKKSYMDIRDWKEQTPEKTLDFEHLENLLTLVKTSWAKGQYLTTKTGLTRSKIYPAAIRYTKPVVITIDEMSGSGGDAFPSMMKGYGLATLVGKTTAGLGGHVNEMPDLNNSAMKIYMTMSLFYRPDGVAVENNGAVPDVEYTLTRDDFLYGYKNYQKFYLKTLFGLIDKNSRGM